ncbi:MAG: hypothetical protein Q4B60_07045 [Erysipelotrichaceae bacterium]|nr:hypothetical protein [Erysipelotrichaceae bacterium]
MKNRKYLFIFCSVLSLLCLYLYFVYLRESFSGICIKNPDSYILNIEKMNGKDMHKISLKDGDILSVHTDVEKGRFNIEISDPDGEMLYKGNEKSDIEEFVLNIRDNGLYTIKIRAFCFKGSISVLQN